ncbi:MAG: FAD-dependent oxidoreductase [Clostridia bacterium]|nr:FAD-dependent oxidoreductase [Clostridia bacterium]MCI2000775.1 FAD-dependent oxidoreductase [Clostridia bacterium]MCI2015433.1 FAD-dependent oxidoreductase [Clostridia bacterium]
MKVLIIGGVAAGTKTAAKIKRINRDADVLIITKGMDISYAGCGLPYYVGNVIADKSGLIVNTPEKFKGLTGADVLVGRDAYKLDAKAKKVYAKNVNTGAEEVYDYDKCVISTGASSIVPKMPGVQLPGVFKMRTPDDAIDLREYMVNTNAKKAVVAGGGFIGLEVAQNLKKQGLDVTVIDLADHVITNFDPEISEYCERVLKRNGIKVLVSTKMESIAGTDKAEGVKTDKGLLEADIVVLSLGIRANTAFLKDTGIEMMPNGTLKIDDQMKTSIPDVYAAGDCVTTRNFQTGKPQWAPMGSAANMEGRVLAQVICGIDKHYKGVLGTAIVKLPEVNAARTGLSEKAAKEMGYDVVTALTVTDDKAHYYPGSAFVSIKLTADRKTHKLLGMQAVGAGEVDKMIDIGATAISMGATLENLEDLDLAYAPPFSTAIHPVVLAVNVILNKINGVLVSMTPSEFLAGAAKGYKIVDAQNVPTIQGALHVVLSETNGPVEGLEKDDKILLVCKRARLAYLLQLRLKAFGYKNTVVLEGASFFNDVVVDEKKK